MKKSSLLRTLYLLVCILPSTQVFSALIDNGDYTTDTISGLDWLDLNFTSGMSYNQAVIDYPGWRHATQGEIEFMFQKVFPSFNDADGDNYDDAFSPSDPLWMEAVYFQDLFGLTLASGGWEKSYGAYMDENNFHYMTGAYISDSQPLARIFLNSITIGLTPDSPDPHNNYSPYLVRTSAVPIPAAAWLFGSGLLGLIGVARLKNA